MIQKLLLPLYLSEAGGEFGAVCFMVCYALTALPVTRTAFLCTGTIDGVYFLYCDTDMVFMMYDGLFTCTFFATFGIDVRTVDVLFKREIVCCHPLFYFGNRFGSEVVNIL